jgi:PhoH-like ATPase
MVQKLNPSVLEVDQSVIEKAFKVGRLTAEDLFLPNLNPNELIVAVCGSSRVPMRVDTKSGEAKVVKRAKVEASGIKPRPGNEEQLFALDLLLDPSVPVVVLTGKAGTGKTLLALAAALHQVDSGKYDKIMLTKPMAQVGEEELGILPGEISDKFGPYLANYTSNLEQIFGMPIKTLMMDSIEMMPLQLIRGASWAGKFIIADEVQSLTKHEILTLGTRVGEGAKLVLCGDFSQRDRPIEVADTGLNHLITSYQFLESDLTGGVELTKVERSRVTALFAEIFS